MALRLRVAANNAINAINPDVAAELWKSTGSTSNADLSRTPNYRKLPIAVQVQALSFDDLHQIEGLNIQGVRRAIYASTQVASIIRVQQKGGDLIVFPKGTPGVQEGTTWLAVHVLERWDDWCKIVLTLQNDNFEAFKC